ncbi:MAG: pilus assembly FimT family protein [Thermodesulfobacteriota bacterium]
MKMNKRGVTLIELVVVLAIIAIGAVLLVPNIRPWIENYRLRTATRDIVSTLRTAQMKAVSNNYFYQVDFAGGSYILRRSSTGLDPEPWPADGAAQTLPSGVSIQNNTFTNPNQKALFRPNSSSNGGTLKLRNLKGSERTITVLPSTGRISIQ